MGKYFIYCNSNQAYHALIHNSIFSKALTRADFCADTASFINRNAIFLTKELLAPELRNYGVTDIYFPVIFEISDDEANSVIPVRFVFKNDGKVAVSEERELLGQYSAKENCLGAFVCGEIPVSLLSAIYFECDKEMTSFKHSSPDLWFPQELFALFENPETYSPVTKEDLWTASEKLDELLDVQKTSEINSVVIKRDKIKALGYYMVLGTEGWETKRIRSNMDGALIRFLDDEAGVLRKTAKKCFPKGNDTIAFEEFFEQCDAIIEDVATTTDGILYRIIMEQLISAHSSEDIDKERFFAIAKACVNSFNDADAMSCAVCFKAIEDYVYTRKEMDPDRALAALGKSSVLKAFMFFLDQQKNFDFLKNTCQKLNQNERRYAYSMFGAYHGMTEVEGKVKSNCQLERRLSEIGMKQYSNEWLVSALPNLPANETCIITPNFEVWFNCEEAREYLLTKASDAQLEKIYMAMKESTVSVNDVYALNEPIIIRVSFQGKEHSFTISQKASIKSVVRDVEKLVVKLEKSGEVFRADEFRKYLSDGKYFEKLYKKNRDLIQNCCRKGEQ